MQPEVRFSAFLPKNMWEVYKQRSLKFNNEIENDHTVLTGTLYCTVQYIDSSFFIKIMSVRYIGCCDGFGPFLSRVFPIEYQERV